MHNLSQKSDNMKTCGLTIIITVFPLLFSNCVQAQSEAQAEKLFNALNAKDLNNALILVQNVNSVNYNGNGQLNLLMLASENGYSEVCKILINKGAKLDLQDKFGETSLFIASQRGRTEVVKLLLDKGAKLDLQDNEGETALMMASEKGHKEVCKILIDKGAKLDLQTNGGVTALMMASMNGNTEIVKLLLEKGANTELKSKEGKTAYDWTHNDTIKTFFTTYKKKK